MATRFNQAKERTFCDDHGHKYEIVANAISRRMVEEGTEISNCFICCQCGETIQRVVALWPEKKKKSDDNGEKF